MLSTKTLSSSAQASHYFMGSDNYYEKDSIEAKEHSVWYGKAAATLGLTGNVDSQVFNALLEGRLPSGQVLGVIKEGVRQHRPGFDLTFSVPKSVSIVGLMGDDKRIFQAIHQSVDHVLSVIEKEAAQARTTVFGETHYENTENIVAAKFLHDLSRECDPQLHIHAVVMNMTERQDGKWRALASQLGKYGEVAQGDINGFIERVRHHKKYYGLLFNATLAFALKELGYDLMVDKKTGNFEIAGISEASIRTFSQRREQIERIMREKGFTSAKAAAVVTLETRKNKEDVDRQLLRQVWEVRCQESSIDTFKEARDTVNRSMQPKTLDEHTPHASYDASLLEYILENFSQDQPTFSENQLLNELLRTKLDRFIPIDAARQYLQQQLKENRLFVRENDQGESVYITAERIEAEQKLIFSASKTHHYLSARRLIELHKIGHAQHSLLHTPLLNVLRSQSLIHAIEYHEEKQKLDAIVPLIKLSQAARLQPLILSASKQSSQKINTIIESQHTWFKHFIAHLTDNSQTLTLSKFLYCMKNDVYHGFFNGHDGAFIVDNAERLSIEDMNALITIAENTDSKIIPLFNNQGMKHWSKSSPIDLLKKSGLSIETLHKGSALEKHDTEVSASRFTSLMEHTLSHESREKALEALASHANGLMESQLKARVILPNRTLAKRFEEIIREKRLGENILSEEHIRTTQLHPVYVKQHEYASSHSYKSGMVVRFNEHYPSLGIGKEDYLQVIESFHRKNQVLLKTASGKSIVWNPNKVGGRKKGAVELYQEVVNTIHVGEKLKINRGMRYKSLASGDLVTVTALTERKIIGITEQGKRVTLNVDYREEQHHAYGYSDTAYQVIPTDTDVILTYHAGNASPFANNMLHSLMTHRDKTLWCYTLDLKKLSLEIQKSLPASRYAVDDLIEHDPENKYTDMVKKALLEGIKNHVDHQNTETIACEAIQYAIQHLSEREAAFTQNELLSVAIKSVLGATAPHELHEALHSAERSGHLVPGIVSVDGRLWTTKEALQEERALLAIAKKGMNQLPPIGVKEAVEAYVEKTLLSTEQRQAITTLCTNTNQVLPIQGLAGVGKTTMMRAFVELCKLNRHEVVVLAPTHTAVKELRLNGLHAQTLDAFLQSNQHDITNAKNEPIDIHNTTGSEKPFPIFILDEATMASTKRQLTLANIVVQRGGKFIPVGDVFQFSSIEAGKAHEQYQSIGITVVKMTDIKRQRDNPELLSAVKSTYQLNYTDVFERLNQHFIEVGEESVNGKTFDNLEARLTLMAEHYLAKSPHERAQTLLITLSNAERLMLNNKIREGLIAEGSLKAPSLPFSILIAKDMTQIERTRAMNYTQNDIVLFGMSQHDLGVKKGDYLTVIDKHIQKNTLILQRDNGDTVFYTLPKSPNKIALPLSVYQKEARDMRIGDWIRWTKSHTELGLLSPDIAIITHIDEHAATCQPITITKQGVKLEQSITLSFHDQRYAHWDYAYAVTNYAAQGRSIQSVNVSLPSEHPLLTTQRAFLVALTRATSSVQIYTDNKDKLLSHLVHTPGDKKSALEAVGRLKPLNRQTLIHQHAPSEKSTTLNKTKKGINQKTHSNRKLLRKQPNIDVERINIQVQKKKHSLNAEKNAVQQVLQVKQATPKKQAQVRLPRKDLDRGEH